MTDAGGTGAAGRPSNGGRRKLLLTLSLALNLLIIGALAGAFFLGPRRGHWHGSSRGEDYGLSSFARQLSADRRSEVRKSIKRDREALRPLFEGIQEARRAAGEALVAEPFDRAKVKAAFDEIGAAEMRLRDAGVDVFLNTAESLTADERKALKAWWEKRRGRYKYREYRERRERE